MTAQITAYLIILRPAALAVVAMTAAAYPVLLLCIRSLQVKGRGTRLAGLFVGLSGRSALHLSCAWVKFAFFAACLLLARTVQPVHYLLLILLTNAVMLLFPDASAPAEPQPVAGQPNSEESNEEEETT